jgi:hypothetical protein
MTNKNEIQTYEIQKIMKGIEILKNKRIHVDTVIIPTFICKLAVRELVGENNEIVEDLQSMINCKFVVSELEDEIKYIVDLSKGA